MKATDALREAGEKIINEMRTELYLSLPFMGPAMDALPCIPDRTTLTLGTDAQYLRYNPRFLIDTYLLDPDSLPRVYMHVLLHCLFRHMYGMPKGGDVILWNLACDIAAESVMDSIENAPAVTRVVPDCRREVYDRLGGAMKTFTAERIYRYFSENRPDGVEEAKLREVFLADDHSFWEEMREQEKKKDGGDQGSEDAEENGQGGEDNDKADSTGGDHSRKDDRSRDDEESGEDRTDRDAWMSAEELAKALSEAWKERAERLMDSLLTFGSERGPGTGEFARVLAVQNRKRVSYRDFLRRYAVVREEAKVDPDSFDYGFYNYGMELYGNLPLIEENEYRESRKVEELVIAIDTSASCQSKLVAQFLSETAAVLQSQETFFHKTDLRIIECDDQVRKDVKIKSPEDIKAFMEAFEVRGGYGTDFRPVFAYIDRLQRAGELRNLRGLLYYTDGFGIYPTHPTPYETVFVYRKDDAFEDRRAPDWAVRLYLTDSEQM